MSRSTIDELYERLNNCCGNKVKRYTGSVIGVKCYAQGNNIIIGRSSKTDCDFRVRHDDDVVHVAGIAAMLK